MSKKMFAALFGLAGVAAGLFAVFFAVMMSPKNGHLPIIRQSATSQQIDREHKGAPLRVIVYIDEHEEIFGPMSVREADRKMKEQRDAYPQRFTEGRPEYLQLLDDQLAPLFGFGKVKIEQAQKE